jgi:uncharacterized protein YuzE
MTMKITVDRSANAAYVKLRTGRIAKTEKSKLRSLEVLLDYDKTGDVIGWEVLNLKKLVELYFAPEAREIRGHQPKSKEIYSYSALTSAQVASLRPPREIATT